MPKDGQRMIGILPVVIVAVQSFIGRPAFFLYRF